MSDFEFDVIDELYFVQGFDHIQKELAVDELNLKNTLWDLLQKEWIKCFPSEANDEVFQPEAQEFANNYKSYYYLATKDGLLLHNSR